MANNNVRIGFSPGRHLMALDSDYIVLMGFLLALFCVFLTILVGVCRRSIPHFARVFQSLPQWLQDFVRWCLRQRRPRCENSSSLDYTGEEGWITNAVCGRCRDIVNSSNILLVNLSERPRDAAHETYSFHGHIASLRLSASKMCHLCTILLYSIRLELENGPSDADWSRNSPYLHSWVSYAYSLYAGRLHVQISRDVDQSTGLVTRFIQLFRGSDPIGMQIEVNRGSSSYVDSLTSPDTGSRLIVDKIHSWVSDCRIHHPDCVQVSNAKPPSRLIRVGDGDSQSRLVLMNEDEDERVPYIALSHCWGNADIPTLITKTYDAMMARLDEDILPQNFKDCIKLCRMLNVNHLWIDSLCILQDSPEDWLRESSNMGNIYHNALFTVAADSSSDSFGGCFQKRNPLACYPLNLLASGHWSSIQLPGFTLENILDDDVNRSPLNKRGWAFQERCLSPRMVHFGKRSVVFECNTMYASDFAAPQEYDVSSWRTRVLEVMDAPHLVNRSTLRKAGRKNRIIKNSQRRRIRMTEQIDDTVYVDARFGYRKSFRSLVYFKGLLSWSWTVFGRLDHNRQWYDLVTVYTARDLTHVSDRLVALDGVAQIIAAASGLQYIGGMWRENLAYNLLWRREGTPLDQPQSKRAPSWSWGAIDSPVSHLFSVGSSISTPFGNSTRKFQTEDLKQWGQEEIVGGQAQIEMGEDRSRLYDSQRPLSVAMLTLDICAFVIEGFIDQIEDDGTGIFRTVDGCFARRCRLDFRIYATDPIPAMMILISSHKATKSVVHGIVARPCDTGEADFFERIGCFRIISGYVYFSNSSSTTKKQFRLV